ncbi:MAG: putative cell wall hydrolase LytN precursor [Chloroflexi bacterium ADurb.Bin180]|nr:MAG: putative cell wall hydrolase LytN precursor [Chloroflexi bacterium ADurb.Bin180]
MRRWFSQSVFVVLAACLILAGAAPASLAAPPSPAGAVYHVVQPGENLYRIGLRYGVSLWSIAQANGIVNVNLIRSGQVLLIPVPAPPPVPVPRIYIVRPGDTLSGIAWRFGTTVWVITRANGIWNPNLIYVGQRLVIP